MEAYKARVESLLNEYKLPESPDHLYESMRYIVSLGGKRLRPVMVLLASDLYMADKQAADKCALAVELFHNFFTDA